jgi:transposase InsO family protein
MNKDLALYSIVRRKKPSYLRGKKHKVHDNLLKQDFTATKPNEKWCTDFTYLFLADGRKRYNCSIIDLYDRSIVASLNGKRIDSRLAIDTLRKALTLQMMPLTGLTLHSDQGVQYTSKEFNAFCLDNNVTQSMSKAGCPYDNAPMERYFNSLKNELIYHYHFKSDEELDKATNDYAYLFYNHKRPHSFNDGLTPYKKRYKKVH